MQIIRDLGVGENLGTSLGKGLASLLEEKISGMKQRKGLETLGISKEQAKAISGLDPNMALLVVKQILQKEPQQDFAKALGSLMGAPSQPGEVQPGEVQPGESGIRLPGLNSQQALQLAQLQTKKQAQQQRLSLAEKKLAFNETKSYRDSVDKASKIGQADLQNLREQEILIDSGKLIGPRENAFLNYIGNKLGFDENQISSFKNPESQVFEKLSVPYFRGLKEQFGARPTQWDAMQFQKGFPTLYQTSEGKKVIIEFMRNASKTAVKEGIIKNRIISESGNIPPLDLAARTNNELSKYKDSQYVKLRNKISKLLISTAGPDVDAAKVGKGVMVENENGIVYISDGKKWKLLFSDSMEN